MRCVLALTVLLLFGQSLLAQDDYNSAVVQGANQEAQGIGEGLSQDASSVLDSLSSAGGSVSSALQPVTGNDFVEPVLGKGVQTLGGGALGELPIADGSAVLGSIAGGDYKAAADTAVAGGMGAVAGWTTGAVVTGLLEGATVTIGGLTAPSWLPPLLAGAAAGWATKSIYSWLLKEPESDTAFSLEAPMPASQPSLPAPGSPKPKGKPIPLNPSRPATQPAGNRPPVVPVPRNHGEGHGGDGHSGGSNHVG